MDEESGTLKPKSKKVAFASRDGLKLHGTFTPATGRTRGAMLMVHGITSDRDEWGIFELFAKELAANGVASLRFDWRGHGASALDEDRITLAGILSDVLAAWDELQAQVGEEGAKARRYIVGSSFGGGVAYAAAARIGGFRRAFLLAPVFDYLVDIDHCAPEWRSELKRKDHFHYNALKLGRGIVNDAFYLNPLAFGSVRTIIFHGTEDADVEIGLSEKVAAANRKIELVPIEGAGHVMNAPEDYDMEKERSWEIVRSVLAQIRRSIG